MIFNEMVKRTTNLLKKIKQLPFNTELASGKLANDKFYFTYSKILYT
jgi:hypothetical protein